MNYRHLFAAPVALAACACYAPMAHAQGINVTVDGEVVPFSGQQPVERAGTILVPLRGVFEKLGASVNYDPSTKTIIAIKGAKTVTLKLGESRAQVNGETRTLALPAQASQGTTLVPLRFVSEALGAGVQWRGASRTVVINTAGGESSGGAAAGGGSSSGAIEATSLTHDAKGALHAGEVLTVTLDGTAGSAATFSIPGIEGAKNLPMKENPAGTYVGTFTLPKGINVKGATVLASLKKNGQSSNTLQAGQPLTIDTVGPTLGSLSPAPDSSVAPGKPLIYGTFSDAGTGVNASATKLVVNGKDVTSQATITEAFFSYKPAAALAAGKTTVSVIATDGAGNQTRKDWGFTVTATENLIKELTFSPDTKTLEPGDELTVKLTAKPGGKARFSIGGTVTNRGMSEQSPGVYVGSYTVKKGDSLSKAPITAAFTYNGQTVTQTAGQSITIAAGAPVKPTITSPQDSAAVGDTVTIRGTAAPNSTVRYSVKYQGVLIVLPTSGTITDGEVKADEKGNWSVPDVRLSAAPGLSKITYQVTATAVGAAGEESEATTVDFKR